MPKVYIVNEPDESRVPEGRATYDVSPAAMFGEVAFIFTADNPPPVRDRDRAIERAHEVLCDAEPGDFIVWAGGDPLGMIIAAAVLADYTDGQFNYLMWDRAVRAYAPVALEVFINDEETE